jgi:hypothetical protein
MADHEKMRASDADRQEVIQRLRTALDEGRLKMDEYLDRMGQASEAVTYGELTPLYADLPASSPVVRPGPAAPAAPAVRRPATPSQSGHPLKVVWTVWGAVVSLNVVIWVLVCASAGQLVYPWPVWVAGPWGAVLLVLTVCLPHGRGSQPDPRRLPPGPQ